ncbi:MAG: hypothetical protein IKN10_02455 [Muribaculaceae bacterium]|nr:hypothetical protein [Muribaculaceae bacterium]
MKKFSLLFVMLLAFTVSTTAQSLPKPANPEIDEFIDYGAYIESSDFYFIQGCYISYSFAKAWDGTAWQLIDVDGNYLDTDKVSFSIYTDNDQVFTFTPEMFDQVDEPTTQFPYNARSVSGDVGMTDIHFNDLTNDVAGLVEIGVDIERFFDWRIGIQTNYTDDGQTNSSDIVYMEIYPQLQEAKNVTSTSFLADWSCDAENTYIINNFIGEGCGYFLHVVDKETQEVVLNQNVEPTDANKKLPGATYAVEGLTPGKTYEFYVEVKQNTGKSYQSVVREVTLPETVYILGEVNEQGWAPNAGTPMEYDAENNVYTATVTLNGRNSGYNYFSFTTRVAENDDQGGWDYILPYRFGAVSDGDFLVTDEMLGIELSMEKNGDAYKTPAGEYKLTVDLANMKLIIEKVTQGHGYELGDVNHDEAVNIGDVTALIDYLLGSGSACEICANVNGDEGINIGDVTALIDKLLNNN